MHLRYLDICLGIILLVSMLCLLYGTYSQSPHFLILFFILSLVVVIGYWTWYVYVNFVSQDSPVFEDQVRVETNSFHNCLTLHFSDWQNWFDPDLFVLFPACADHDALQTC